MLIVSILLPLQICYLEKSTLMTIIITIGIIITITITIGIIITRINSTKKDLLEKFTVDGIKYNIISLTDKTVAVGNYMGCTGGVNIPPTVTYNKVTYSVTEIGESAFWVCSGLTSVTIPNSVTWIRENVFSGCSGLTSVTIPNSVTEIGNYVFADCI